MLKRLSVLSLLLAALLAAASAAEAATETLAVALAVRAPDGAPVADFTLKLMQADTVLAECVTDAAGVCGFVVTWDVAGADLELTADGYTWAAMKNVVGGGQFAPGERLWLYGEGVSEASRATGAAADAGAQFTVLAAFIADAGRQELNVDPDPAARPDPAAVTFRAATAIPPPATATNPPTATLTPVPPTNTPEPPTATVPAPTAAPTSTPVPAPATPDWPANGGLLLLGAVVIGAVMLFMRKPKAAR